METWEHGNMEIWKYENMKQGNMETWKYGNWKICKIEIWIQPIRNIQTLHKYWKQRILEKC